MKTNAIQPGSTAAPTTGIARGRVRGRTLLACGTFAVFGGIALATPDEKYPDWGDGEIEAKVGELRDKVKREASNLCTGKAVITGSQSTRDPLTSTPVLPGWVALGGDRSDGAGQYESHIGADTDTVGTDSYLYVKLVGSRANVFLKAILEAEDGAHAEWAVHYMGQETLDYENGPYRRAEKLTVTNPWAIGWTRRIVDFDAMAGEYDETKAIDQSFAVRCELIDGSSVGDGGTFSRVVPLTQGATTSAGLKLKAGGKVGTAPGADYGGELGFETSSSTTYDTKFHSLTDESGELEGTAIVTGDVPCPFEKAWTATTYLDGQFSILDHEFFDGDKGSRQELLVTVINFIASIRVDACHACGTSGSPIPVDPPPPPRTPSDPTPPTTPGTPVPPTTPTTTSGESQPGTPSAATPGRALTPSDGYEPGWGGVPPAKPGADPAVGTGSSSQN